MFYAPARGLGEAREGVSLGGAALLALLMLGGLLLFTQWPYFGSSFAPWNAFVAVRMLISSAGLLLFLALVFVPLLIVFANLFDRRASVGLALRQEYPAVATAISYALAAAVVVGFVAVAAARYSGVEAWFQHGSRQFFELGIAQNQVSPEVATLLMEQSELTGSLMLMLSAMLPPFALWAVAAAREALRLTWGRAVVVVVASGVLTITISPIISFLSALLASPFLLVLLVLFLRGYLNELAGHQRARAAFKQNLEAATLNPADSSAHYNLGLLYLQRKEVNEARDRFRRAIEIDADEIDAHYQLGRISREQGRDADAIKHFEQVVERDDRHAQHEVWREIGATYLAAGQFADARDALARFLDRRENDPEGLYLMGRSLAGLHLPGDAAAAMRACIEAVKTAPAYKYRAEKRWLNEAQQFLRSQA